MRIRELRLAVVVVALATLFSPTLAATAERADTFILKVNGAAVVFGSTCPFTDELPPVTVECRDWQVILFKEGSPAEARTASWGVQLEVAHFRVHPDGTVDSISEAFGVTDDLESVSFDTRHLTGASVRAVVPMSDDSQRVVDLVWDGSSAPRVVAGNHGPFSVNNDIPRHIVDRCFTENVHSHQTYRAEVEIAGTIDGVDVDSIPYFNRFDPFISRAVFTVIAAPHGGAAC